MRAQDLRHCRTATQENLEHEQLDRNRARGDCARVIGFAAKPDASQIGCGWKKWPRYDKSEFATGEGAGAVGLVQTSVPGCAPAPPAGEAGKGRRGRGARYVTQAQCWNSP